MGGVNYTGGCIFSNLDGGSADGGFTLRLPAGTHHLDGKQALALARTRENLCAPNETEIQREEHQQALFTDMKNQLLSPSSFFRLPWIAWHAPPAIISDMSGVELLGMFAALAVAGYTANARAAADGTDHPARRGRRADDLRRSAPRGRRAIHGRLSGADLGCPRATSASPWRLLAVALRLVLRVEAQSPSPRRAFSPPSGALGGPSEDLAPRTSRRSPACTAVSRWRLRVP